MADVYCRKKRSEVMSKIRGRGNKSTELKMMELFKELKITGWRRNQKIFGNPDFVFKNIKTVVFVDGCFWHGCTKHYRKPSSNILFWEKKYRENKKRDKITNSTLKKMGWNVVRIWEHELKNRDGIMMKLCKIFSDKG